MVKKQMINSINLVTPSPAPEKKLNLFCITAPMTKFWNYYLIPIVQIIKSVWSHKSQKKIED